MLIEIVNTKIRGNPVQQYGILCDRLNNNRECKQGLSCHNSTAQTKGYLNSLSLKTKEQLLSVITISFPSNGKIITLIYKWFLRLCMVRRIRVNININMNSKLQGKTMCKISFEGVMALKKAVLSRRFKQYTQSILFENRLFLESTLLQRRCYTWFYPQVYNGHYIYVYSHS